MSETALIEMPDGSPGAVSDAGTSLQRVAGGFERGGGVVARASSTVSAWEGRASVSFQGRAASYGLVMVAVDRALSAAQAAVRRYETALEDARARIRHLREQEEMAVARLERAKGHLEDAQGRLASAQQRMSVVSSGAGLSEPFSMSESIQAAREADDAQADIDAAQKQIDREREEIRELREDARRERTQLIQAEQDAAGAVRGAAALLPDVQLPGGAASPSAYAGTIFAGPVSPFARDPRWGSAMAKAATDDEAEDDRAWYEKAPGWLGDQAVGAAKGFGEGVVGIGEGGLMLYRMSLTNAIIDRDSFDRQWADTGKAAEFAWQHPGEFGKAVVNWEDLEAGRFGEWGGGFGPDALLAVGTAGVGTAATRGLRGADALADTADAARDVDRVTEGAPTHSFEGIDFDAPDAPLLPHELYAPHQGTPVLGRLDDTRPFIGRDGYAVLDLDNWSINRNDQWIDSVGAHRPDIHLASPLEGNLWDDEFNRPTVFGRELERLENLHDYRREGSELRPSPPRNPHR